jgi:hypothetical protein
MTPTIIWTSWIVVIFAVGLINKYQHQIGVKIHEGLQKYGQMIIVAILAILHGIFIADVHTPKNWLPDDYTLAVMMFYPFAWLALFDAMYNPMIGQPVFSYGTTAWVDRKIFKKIGMSGYVTVKLFALIITVVCIVIIYTDHV